MAMSYVKGQGGTACFHGNGTEMVDRHFRFFGSAALRSE